MTPEYKIILRVNVQSLDEVTMLVDQISAVANPSEISARQIAGVTGKEKRMLFDNQVKSIYIDEGKKLTVLQIAEKLGVSSTKLNLSIRRLKDSGEIENVRKFSPNRVGKFEYGSKILMKQELKRLIVENPDEHYTLSEFKDQLGGKISREGIRQLLVKLKEEGLEFVSHREYNEILKAELVKQKDSLKHERQQIIDEVKKLLMEGYSGPKIERMLADKADGIIHITTVINMLRKKGEIPKKRKPKRSFDELVATNNEVKKLFIKNLSYRKISAITGLTISQIEYSLNRMNSKGEIFRRRLYPRKNK